MHCAQTKLHLTEYHKIPYPDPTHYAESLDIYDGYIYAPLIRGFLASLIPRCGGRRSPSGLYRIRAKPSQTDTWELMFPFAAGSTILGGKVKDGRFVGTDTKNHAIIVYDLMLRELHSISVPGCPNDVCFDPDDNDVVYVVSNASQKAKNGMLLRVNLRDKKVSMLYEDLTACAGVNVRGAIIYVATLIEVIAIDKRNPVMNSRAILGEKTRDWPFFDNITTGPRNSLLVAVYAHGQRAPYGVMRNSLVMRVLMSCVVDAGYFDKHNVDQLTPMANTNIRFARIHSSFYEYVLLDAPVPNYDCYITQINQTGDNNYVCVNYKANGILFFTATVVDDE